MVLYFFGILGTFWLGIIHMNDNEAKTHLSSSQKLRAILDCIGELKAHQKTQSSKIEPTTNWNEKLAPNPPPNPPNPMVVNLPKTLKELGALTLNQ